MIVIRENAEHGTDTNRFFSLYIFLTLRVCALIQSNVFCVQLKRSVAKP